MCYTYIKNTNTQSNLKQFHIMKKQIILLMIIRMKNLIQKSIITIHIQCSFKNLLIVFFSAFKIVYFGAIKAINLLLR